MKIVSFLASLDQVRGSPLGPMLRESSSACSVPSTTTPRKVRDHFFDPRRRPGPWLSAATPGEFIGEIVKVLHSKMGMPLSGKSNISANDEWILGLTWRFQ